LLFSIVGSHADEGLKDDENNGQNGNDNEQGFHERVYIKTMEYELCCVCGFAFMP
jgi:hypothetical protein